MLANCGKKNQRRKRVPEARIRTKKTDLMWWSAVAIDNFFQKKRIK